MQQYLNVIFKKYSITMVNPLNKQFDPKEHHSVGFVPNKNQNRSNIVVEVKRKGWKLKDRVLREAYVLIYK